VSAGAKGPVVVLGAGASGEHFVGALRRRDPDVAIAVVERHLAGGECSYYACIPTKTLLRPLELVAAARRAPGAAEAITGEVDAHRVRWWRDQVTSNRDDSWHAGWLEENGAELVRGDARVVRPGVVDVDGRELEYETLVVATGSAPAIPTLEGIDDVPVWTSRDAVWAESVPESLVVMGGGPVGVELAQFFQRLGSGVTIVEKHGRVLARLDSEAGELLGERLAEDGIEIRTEIGIERVAATVHGLTVHLGSGAAIEAEGLLVATGRRPNVDGFGLEELGVEITRRGVTVDDRLRAAENVWAVGDVTGIALFTHVGKYQARVAADNIVGLDRVADYRAIPATIFTDPQVASVGDIGREGLVTISHKIDGGRLSTYERPRRPGLVKLAADPGRRVVVGAVAVGPEAGEWLGQLTLAVRSETPIDVLLDTIQPYPTFSEHIFDALLELEDRLAG
jgi:pyruvate/2-oxoglutarate dehydrogenase complex dihydrolipoamide dehydrogenase (E3) component